MAEIGELRVDVSVDPRVHAVEAVRDLKDVLPEIVASGIKVEIEFSTMKTQGSTNTRDSIALIFSKEDI
jgi:hypothetical protein